LKKILCFYNKNFLILDIFVSLRDFYLKKKIKKKNNSIVYIGSFFYGKGLELIYSIAKQRPDFEFDLYGDASNTIKSNYNLKNLKFFGHINYNKIPETLAKYEYAIMPYGDKVKVSSSNLEVSRTMSPLKMFDYLASKKIIFASKLKVYDHILKNNYNSILIKNNSPVKWIEAFRKIKKNRYLKLKIRNNAYKTAEKYTWIKRVKVIEKNFFLT